MKKKILILVLVIVAVGMGVGYSILSKQLKIEGTATLETDFDVAITGIERIDGSTFLDIMGDIGSDGYEIENSAPTFTSTTATFDVKLTSGKSIAYAVKIKNSGDIPVVFDSINVKKTGSEVIKVETPFNFEGIILYPNGEFNYVVELSYDESKEVNSSELESRISIDFNIIQKTSEEQNYMEKTIYSSFAGVVFDNTDIVGVKIKNLYAGPIGAAACNDDEKCGWYVSIDGGEFESVNLEYNQEENCNIYHFPNLSNDGISSSHTLVFRFYMLDKVQSNDITLKAIY